MTIGDRASQLAQNFLFPIINMFDPKGPFPGTKIFTAPNGLKCIYRNHSLDRLVIWEQWGLKEYDGINLNEESVILEIGSHIGTSTMDFAKKLKCKNGN
jgi:hypothetical protein